MAEGLSSYPPSLRINRFLRVSLSLSRRFALAHTFCQSSETHHQKLFAKVVGRADGSQSLDGRRCFLGRLSFSAWVSVVSDSTRRINEIKKAAISMELDAVRLCGQKRRQDEMTNQRTTCSRFRSLLAASSFPLWV